MPKSKKPQLVKRHVGAAMAHKKPNGNGRMKPRKARQDMTPKRWEKYLKGVANGLRHGDAAFEAGVSEQTVDAYLVSNVAATQQLTDAKLLWNRRDWPMHLIEDVLREIAMGATLKAALIHLGIPQERRESLHRVLLLDKAINKMYADARALQMESFSDEIIEISDDTALDRDEEGKANHELVNRSRLRVDTRRFLMQTLGSRRFGSTKHHIHEGDINVNHAAVLTGGRRRLEKLHAERKGQTVEGEIVESNE